jgi:hypothetical protein
MDRQVAGELHEVPDIDRCCIIGEFKVAPTTRGALIVVAVQARDVAQMLLTPWVPSPAQVIAPQVPEVSGRVVALTTAGIVCCTVVHHLSPCR